MTEQGRKPYRTFDRWGQAQLEERGSYPKFLYDFSQIGVERRGVTVSVKNIYTHFKVLIDINPKFRITKPWYDVRRNLAKINARGKKNRLNTKFYTGRKF